MRKHLAAAAIAVSAFLGLGAAVATTTSTKQYDRTVYIVNQSQKVSDTEVENDLPAFQKAVEDFEHYWGGSVKLVFVTGSAPPKRAWVMTIKDVLDNPYAYGYHGLEKGVPFSQVGTDGYWTVTFTHELFEMLADPYINRLALVANLPYLVEVADPVEDDRLAYFIKNAKDKGIRISDFVYPGYYVEGAPGPYDYQHLVKAPTDLLIGGYISWWTPSGWQQWFDSTR